MTKFKPRVSLEMDQFDRDLKRSQIILATLRRRKDDPEVARLYSWFD